MQILISSDSIGQFSYHLDLANGASWEDVYADLTATVLTIKERIRKNDSLGIGLQPSIHMMNELSNPAAFAQLRQFLSKNQCFLHTTDGFNKDLFDWKDAKLLSYHNSLADLLSKSLPPQITGSISSVPGTPKAFVKNDADIKQISQHWVSHAEYLIRLERKTRKQIVLAVQPKPMSFLETAQEVVDFFNQHVFSPRSCSYLSHQLNVNCDDAEDLLRTHITVCVDLEDVHGANATLDAYVNSIESQGVCIGKKQLHLNGEQTACLPAETLKEINQITELLEDPKLQIEKKRAA